MSGRRRVGREEGRERGKDGKVTVSRTAKDRRDTVLSPHLQVDDLLLEAGLAVAEVVVPEPDEGGVET